MLFDPLVIAFLIIGLGYLFQKKVGFDQATASNLLIYVTGPALAFSAIYSKPLELSEFAVIVAAPLVMIAVTGTFAFIAYRLLKYGNTGMLLPAMFINSGYLGFPIALFALGEAGLQKAVIFDAVTTILNFTIGVYLVQKAGLKTAEKIIGIFRIPLVYGIVLGVLFNFLSVSVPVLVVDTLSLLGSATIPLALVALGGRLATLRIGKLTIPLVAVFSRMVVGGVVGIMFVKLLNIGGITGAAIMLLSVMPPAMNSYVLNEKFSKDPDNAATAVLIGTGLSVIPIAIVLSML